MQHRLRTSAILHRSPHAYLNVSRRTFRLSGLRALLTERFSGSVTRTCSQRRTDPAVHPIAAWPGAFNRGTTEAHMEVINQCVTICYSL
jgi:hypothetical protein